MTQQPRTPLRPIQRGSKASIIAAWLVCANVLLVSPTGSGKTVLFSDIVADEPGNACVIAHRSELVAQMSLSLAKMGIRHRIIGGKDLTAECSATHVEELGTSYISQSSNVVCASVKTLVGEKCQRENKRWFATVKLWVMDEAHHVLRHNEWGAAVALFPNARGLGVTATPERADGYGLGAMNDGVFEQMIIAPGMREHIDRGYLTDYRIFCPPCDIDLSTVPTTAKGEFSPKPLAVATRNSHITSDAVKAYLRIAPGKLGITFAVDVGAAAEVAQAFRDAGVTSEMLTAKTPAATRRAILRKFRDKRVMMLVNVDLFGEGFDMPACEVVIMARATQSLNLFIQQFGRCGRLMIDPTTLRGWSDYTDAERRYSISISTKPAGIVIDLVGNTLRHGLPDKFRNWSLGSPIRRSKKPKDEHLIEMTACAACTMPYELIYRACPHCGDAPAIADRTRVEFVQGDVTEIAPAVLAIMRGDIAAFDAPPSMPYGVDDMVRAGIRNRHAARCEAQDELRATIALWAGYHRDQGRDDSQIYRLFYLTYGVDVLGAQVLKRKEAEALTLRLQIRLDEAGVISY